MKLNKYEKSYLENYDLLYQLMSRVAVLEGDRVCTRSHPSIESKIMFNRFAGTGLVEKKFDITTVNKNCIGPFVKGSQFDSFNQITLSGPSELVDAFVTQDLSARHVNIFINAIKPIQGTTVLWDRSAVNIESYAESEHPVTQQYCNWYDFFEQTYGESFTYDKHFVVIFTNAELLDAYRELYPHFIFCVQITAPFQTIGLTRYSMLALAYALDIPRILCPEDNTIDFELRADTPICDLASNPDPKCTPCNPKLSLAVFLEELFIRDKIGSVSMSNVGYVGFNIGISICNEEWEKYLQTKEFIHDEVAKFKINTNADLDIKTRLYTKKTVDLQNVSWSTFGTKPLPNPHRPKAIMMNTSVLKKHNVNYNVVQTLGEDIYFTKCVYLNGISVLQVDIRIVFPGESRRPFSMDDKKGSCKGVDTRCRFFAPEFISAFENNFFIETLCDLIILEGRIIYFDPNGIYAGSGVYGPLRVITKADELKVRTELEQTHNKDNIGRFLNRAYIHSKKNYEVYYVKTSKYNFNLPNMTESERIASIDSYIVYDDKDKNLVTYENSAKRLIANNIMLYDFGSINDGQILRSGGQQKYLLRYEYINHLLHLHFANMCKKKKFIGLIRDTFEKIIRADRNIKNRGLIIDDLSFYLSNYDLFPADVYRILSLLILYIKYSKIQSLIQNQTPLTKKQLHLLLFAFGNINSGFYVAYGISTKCSQIIQLVADLAKEDNQSVTLTDPSGRIAAHIEHIYKILLEKN